MLFVSKFRFFFSAVLSFFLLLKRFFSLILQKKILKPHNLKPAMKKLWIWRESSLVFKIYWHIISSPRNWAKIRIALSVVTEQSWRQTSWATTKCCGEPACECQSPPSGYPTGNLFLMAMITCFLIQWNTEHKIQYHIFSTFFLRKTPSSSSASYFVAHSV